MKDRMMNDGNNYEEKLTDAESPTVTVFVVTYNSASTILETLESIRSQTYQNIGLIVSDDCSTDETVRICSEWLENYRPRFLFAQILTAPKNTGVSGNVNRAIDACHTEFCKGLAGDDLLLPDCIEKNVAFMKAHPDSIVVFSKVQIFGKRRALRRFAFPFNYEIFNKTAAEQYRYLTEIANCIPASTEFFRMEGLRQNNIRCDERIPMVDDWPLWIIITGKGFKLDFFDETTVLYRVREGSLTTSRSIPFKAAMNLRLVKLFYVFENEYKKNPEAAINRLATEETLMLEKSHEYLVGKMVLRPIRRIKSSRIKHFLSKLVSKNN